MTDYATFIANKSQVGDDHGFDPVWMPDFLFDFQKYLVEWACRKGRGAIFATTGLGKTAQELVWAQNIVEKTNKPVLIIAPLAVSYQIMREAKKFGVECERSSNGKFSGRMIITNYERLDYFNPYDFVGVACDESNAIKDFSSSTKAMVTEFVSHHPYRLLATATPAPNDYFELGTSSEALGYLRFADVLSRFFKKNDGRVDPELGRRFIYRFRGHAAEPFWRWLSMWSRICRKPSDLGFDHEDDEFELPPLVETEYVINDVKSRDGLLFSLPAITLAEQREERRITINERCLNVTEKVCDHDGQSVVWCHLNDEGDLLEKMIPESLQVTGSMPDELKEERLMAFSDGEIKVLVSKPSICGHGLNWQNCHNIVTFPSYSWMQYYQSIRRCWRYGQKHAVQVSIVSTPGESRVLSALKHKAEQADAMYDALVSHMKDAVVKKSSSEFVQSEKLPSWLYGDGMVIDQKISDLYALYNGDSAEVLQMIPDGAVHLSIYSPPFALEIGGCLYNYSDSDRDLSNNMTYDEFFEHYEYIVKEISRVTMPGRISAVHCMDMPLNGAAIGGYADFPGEIIRLHQQHGFEMLPRITIWKEPLGVRNRTMMKSLAHKQIVEDSTKITVAPSDFLIPFRKIGDNPIPVQNPHILTIQPDAEPE